MIGKFTMKSISEITKGICGRLNVVVATGSVFFSIFNHSPIPCPPTFSETYSFYTRCVVYLKFYVLSIFKSRCQTQIGDPVISSITVNVVNLIWRKRPVNIEPRQPVKVISNLVDSSSRVTALYEIPSYGPFRSATRHKHTPSKYPSIGIVMEKFFQPFLSQFVSVFHNTKSKGQQQEVETVADLLRGSKLPQIFGMNSTSCRALIA